MVESRASSSMERWWSSKYGLPPNHPLFLKRTEASLHQELMEDLFAERKSLAASIESDGDMNGKKHSRLQVIEKALGIRAEEREAPPDELFEQWERDFAAGKIPDLDAMPPGAER